MRRTEDECVNHLEGIVRDMAFNSLEDTGLVTSYY